MGCTPGSQGHSNITLLLYYGNIGQGEGDVFAHYNAFLSGAYLTD